MFSSYFHIYLFVYLRVSSNAANQTELMQSCLATIKTTMTVIQKFSSIISAQQTDEETNCKKYLETFKELSWNILSHGESHYFSK